MSLTIKDNCKSRYLPLITCLLILFSCTTKKKEIENTSITFENEVYDFGEILAGENVSVVFLFTNTGKNPLVINDVKTSCGCTTPDWKKEIIPSNKTGVISVIFDAKTFGRFRKNIFVYYNGEHSPYKITIKGEVDYLSLLK